MDKNVVLSNEELELLITGLHCVDERSYNFIPQHIHLGVKLKS